MCSVITKVLARQIFDSRGNPTVEVDVTTTDGVFRSAVPSGASTGTHEALELRDGGKDYHGKAVFKAIENVNSIVGPKLVEAQIPVVEQARIDQFMIELDGTSGKSNLGANAILGVSMSVARAGAAAKKVPLYRHLADLAGNSDVSLPCPSFNVINGGEHASNLIVFQEFMIMPAGAKSFAEAMKMGSEVYHHLKKILAGPKYNQETQVGDEGGFAPSINTASEVLQVITEAIEAAGHTGKIYLAMDSAASEFYDSETKTYNLDKKSKLPVDQQRRLTSAQMVQEYKDLIAQYPNLISFEDPLAEDDWEAWTLMTESCSRQVVGDDLTVTNIKRIQTAVEKKSCNALLLKINQIGTITESIQAAQLSMKNGWKVMVSHRSGETEDTFIADLVVGLKAGQIKSGAPSRSERLCKYNQLLRIEEELGSEAVYDQLTSLVN